MTSSIREFGFQLAILNVLTWKYLLRGEEISVLKLDDLNWIQFNYTGVTENVGKALKYALKN